MRKNPHGLNFTLRYFTLPCVTPPLLQAALGSAAHTPVVPKRKLTLEEVFYYYVTKPLLGSVPDLQKVKTSAWKQWAVRQ